MTTRPADSIHAPIPVPVQPGFSVPLEAQEMAARLGVSQDLPKAIELTREIFGDVTQVTVIEDPEFLGEDHIEFHVPAVGTVEEVLDREEEWGRRMKEVIPRSPQVFLVFSEFSL